jgi:membrane-associated HD superfamily phosphohydrolase
MATLNIELINTLTNKYGDTVLELLTDDNAKKILNGAEISGEKGTEQANKISKYLDKKGSNACAETVSSMLETLAKRNGKNNRAESEATKATILSDKELQEWRSDFEKSDEHFNKAALTVENVTIKATRIVSVKEMHIVDAEEYLMFMDSENINSCFIENLEYRRVDCIDKINEMRSK